MKSKSISLQWKFLLLISVVVLSALTGQVRAQSLDKLRERIVKPKLGDTSGLNEVVVSVKPKRSELFSQFSGGLGGLFNGSSKGTSFDLSSLTFRYFVPTAIKNDTVTVVDNEGNRIPGAIRSRYKGFNVYLINRAALNTDSLKTLANDYITSLQSSPITFRLSYDGYLTKNRVVNVNQVLPVVRYRFSGDVRGVPYGNDSGTVDFGASYSFFFSILAQLRGIQDEEGVIEDEGTFYFEPSIGVVGGTKSMMETMFVDGKSRMLVTGELRMGFLSDNNKIRDFGIIARYTWADISGAKFKIGLSVAPNFK